MDKVLILDVELRVCVMDVLVLLEYFGEVMIFYCGYGLWVWIRM